MSVETFTNTAAAITLIPAGTNDLTIGQSLDATNWTTVTLGFANCGRLRQYMRVSGLQTIYFVCDWIEDEQSD
jgi:hypothetical protein